jgi:transcriptional regulator with XRE-family HTH domain
MTCTSAVLVATPTASTGESATPESMKLKTLEGFGPRLAALRQARGITQTELGDAVGASQRVIAYYESDAAQPPGSLLVDLARALKVSADELLGLEPVTEKTPPKTARLLKRLRRVEELPPADQRAVLKLVDAMLETRRRATPSRTKRKAS